MYYWEQKIFNGIFYVCNQDKTQWRECQINLSVVSVQTSRVKMPNHNTLTEAEKGSAMAKLDTWDVSTTSSGQNRLPQNVNFLPKVEVVTAWQSRP